MNYFFKFIFLLASMASRAQVPQSSSNEGKLFSENPINGYIVPKSLNPTLNYLNMVLDYIPNQNFFTIYLPEVSYWNFFLWHYLNLMTEIIIPLQ
jgi:hypothetical protein